LKPTKIKGTNKILSLLNLKFRYGGNLVAMNAYERHKKYINDYVIHYGKYKEYTQPKVQYKTDADILREQYK
jgi:protein FRA10AC1